MSMPGKLKPNNNLKSILIRLLLSKFGMPIYNADRVILGQSQVRLIQIKDEKMMKSKLAMVTAMSALLAVAGCGANESNQKQTGGAVIGAVGGALLGSLFGKGTGQLVAVGVGTLAGAMIGSEVGKTLDAADRAQLDRAEKRATTAPIGQQITWNNPQSGNSGTITPVRDGTDDGGRYCREFQQNIVIGGKVEKGYGQACRKPDGSWEIMS